MRVFAWIGRIGSLRDPIRRGALPPDPREFFSPKKHPRVRRKVSRVRKDWGQVRAYLVVWGQILVRAFISKIIEINIAIRNHFDNIRNMKMIDSPLLDVEIAASKFAALGSEQRLLVLHALVRAGTEGLTIGTLGDRTGITGSTLTHHLKILSAAGLVTQARQGRSIICAAADYSEVEALSDYLLRQCCADVALCHKDTKDG